MVQISVVIPTYKRSLIIEKSINSCLNQTFPPSEIIVVDDASGDDTRDFMKSLQSPNVDMRYIEMTSKGGAQKARNEGIRQARYSWIAFNDSDDEWLPYKLETQLKSLAKKNFDPYTVIHGNCLAEDHDLKTQVLWELPRTEGIKPFHLLLKRASPLFPTILTSKKALEEIGYLDENVPSYQEWDTALLLSKLCSFIHIQEPLFIYHMHKGETISKNKKRDIAGHHYILMKYRKDIIDEYGKQYFIDALLTNIKRIVNFGEWNFGVKLLAEVRPYIPLKSFVYYTTCFKMRVSPNTIKEKYLK